MITKKDIKNFIEANLIILVAGIIFLGCVFYPWFRLVPIYLICVTIYMLFKDFIDGVKTEK